MRYLEQPEQPGYMYIASYTANNNNTELGKGIVETLLSCNLTSLRYLNLGTFGYNSVNTSISDKEGARTRLKQYYPNITSLSL